MEDRRQKRWTMNSSMQENMRWTALALVVLAFPIIAWADLSGNAILDSSFNNSYLNLETGATGSFQTGGDIYVGSSVSNGKAIFPQPGVSLVWLAAGPCIPDCGFDSLTEEFLKSVRYTNTPIFFSSLTAGSVFAVRTKNGSYSKLLVVFNEPGGIKLQFTTYNGNGPTIKTVQNNYGLIPQGLPNYGIAPGALFFITGSGLANFTTDLQSSGTPGLQTTVNGVSVKVTVGSTTVQCFLYYLSPTQINAVLPGTTAVGTGTLIVTNNGVTSGPVQIPVVQSAFGILSYNGNQAAAYNAANSLLTGSNSANPNETIVLWGSGVGSDPSNDDKLFPQKQNNLTNIPMQAFVGGLPATVVYRGRSQFPGLDQVLLTIPSGVPTGCFVSVMIVSGTIVSNSATIPITASGRTCSDANLTSTPDLIQTLSRKSSVKYGFLDITQFTLIAGGPEQ
jgi:uncharacterized protein (TIGR03437 family)